MKKILIVFFILVECQTTTKNSTYNSDEKIEQEKGGNSGGYWILRGVLLPGAPNPVYLINKVN